MLVALDTNVLAYAENANGAALRQAADDLLNGLVPESTLIPVQALGELFNVLVKKAGLTGKRARTAAISWAESYPVIESSEAVMAGALGLAVDHRLRIWDAVILAAAADAKCRLLLSEDLQDGFTWSGVTVVNPFVPTRHPLLDAILK